MSRFLTIAVVAVLAVGASAPDGAAQSQRRIASSSGAASAMAGASVAPPPTSAVAQLQALKKNGETANTQLFGTEETLSENFQPFEKWTGAVDKMNKERASLDRFKAQFKKWLDLLDALKDKDVTTKIAEVNKLMNQYDYVTDPTNWGVSDYWSSPGEFLAKFGDCEDYAIAKYWALKYIGFPANKMRIVAVKDLNLKVGHAILAVYLDDHVDILDNQIKIVVDSRKIHHYEPVYSINEFAWWRHRATGAAPAS